LLPEHKGALMADDVIKVKLGGESKPSLNPERWWTTDKSVAEAITCTIQTIADAQKSRMRQMDIASRLYGNLPTSGSAGMSFARLASVYPAMRSQITRNVLQIAVDTYVSQVATEKPRPYFVTSGGRYHEQRRAKLLTKFTDGCFYEGKIGVKAPAAARDCAVWGTGIIHTYPRRGRVCFERVLPHEIWVDEIEAFDRSPRQMHRVRNVDRELLADLFPKHADLVRRAGPADLKELGSVTSISDCVSLRESWHLRSSPDGEDGRHVISIAEGVLLDEEWARDDFPFSFLRWNERLYGFWGQGGVEQCQNTQLEINSLMQVTQRAYRLGGSFKVLLESGSKVLKEHINDDIGTIVNYTGTPPQYVVPPLIPPEIYEHMRELAQSIYETFGVSQMAARSTAPAGVTSGVALREVRDEAQGRMLPAAQEYGEFHLDLARKAIETVKEIVKESEGGYRVNVPGRKFISQLDWGDVSLEGDQYIMQCFPTSSLPKDPAGRLQTVQERVQAGFITLRQAKRAMDFPDLETMDGLDNASENYMTITLDNIVDKGEYVAPEPFDDLTLAREMALEYYEQGKSSGLDEERLEMLRRFMSQIQELVQPSNPALPPQEPQGAAPQAAAAPPPVSDLIPNAPSGAGAQQ
jgi:hypothetical protein